MINNSLNLKNLSLGYDGEEVLCDISFDFIGGQIYGVYGANGVGKTSLLNAISGITTVQAGRIELNKLDIAKMDPARAFQFGIARSFQEPHVFHSLSVIDNVNVASNLGNIESFGSSLIGKRSWFAWEEETNKKSSVFLEMVGLQSKENYTADQLSYGEKRLLGLARLMASNSSCYLFDEPLSGLNQSQRKKFRRIVEYLIRQHSIVIIVDHEVEFLEQISNVMIELRGGVLVANPNHVYQFASSTE